MLNTKPSYPVDTSTGRYGVIGWAVVVFGADPGRAHKQHLAWSAVRNLRRQEGREP
jgi:hypothetical protein